MKKPETVQRTNATTREQVIARTMHKIKQQMSSGCYDKAMRAKYAVGAKITLTRDGGAE